MMNNEKKEERIFYNGCCPVCEMCVATHDATYKDVIRYDCGLCGVYYIPVSDRGADTINKFDKEQLAQYLYYNKGKKRLLFLQELKSKDTMKQFDGYQFITPKDVENWYPKTFAQKADKVLLKLAEKAVFDGAYIEMTDQEKKAMYFACSPKKYVVEFGEAREIQVRYMENFLQKQEYIVIDKNGRIQLTPKALDRVYELQKNNADNDRAFVAIQFDVSTQDLRERIREGLQMAGYQAIIMDEEHYNGQIVPEMLHQINTCNFVVAELTSKNQNVYFEAGYATGQNKEVIYLCNGEKLDTSPQFDVAQYNLLTYKKIDEIPQKLKARIEATIGRR